MLLPVPPVTGVSTAKCDMYPKNCNGTVFNSTNLNFTSTPMVTTMNTAAMETTIGTEATQSLDDYLLVLIEFYPKASTSILNFQLINFTFDLFIYINARIYYDTYYIYYFFQMDIQIVIFILCFICGDNLATYWHNCNRHFK